jgi:release factor glutamine methyltransferase
MAPSSTPVWTIGSLLTWTAEFFTKKSVDEPRLSAELLLAHTLNCSRMSLYTQYEKVPTEEQLAPFRDLVKQRAQHVPVAYLIGKAWFFSLEFTVTRDVLIPRPDTETLVEFVIQHARQRPEWTEPGGSGAAILDLCTGSGAVAVALAKRLPTATITATDVSAKALAVAKMNAQTHKVAERMTLLEGDLFEPLDTMPAPTLFHVITANPPYIPTAEIANLPPTVRDHEPRLALDGGPDGLAFHRRILEGAKRHLHPGGLLIMEMQFDQGPALQAAYVAAGLTNVRVIRDATGHPRCVVGTFVE